MKLIERLEESAPIIQINYHDFQLDQRHSYVTNLKYSAKEDKLRIRHPHIERAFMDNSTLMKANREVGLTGNEE